MSWITSSFFHHALLVSAAWRAMSGPMTIVNEARADGTVPHLDHVVVIVMENRSYDQVRTAPYTATLVTAGSSFSQYYAITHPSQPNYIAMWAGSQLGVSTNTCPAPGSPFTAENLGHACEAAGLTWKAYVENLPSPGYSGCFWDGTLYTRKHAPWTNFSNLNHDNERPFDELAVDEANGTLPNLAFVIPNNCHNSHDAGCTVLDGDTWLSQNVPGVLNAVGPRGLVVLTWDEDDSSSGNHILTVFNGALVRPNYISTPRVHHYTLLRTICDGLGIVPFGFAAQLNPITDVWIGETIPVSQQSWSGVKSLYR